VFKTQNDTLLWISNVELIISFFTCMKANKIIYFKNKLISPNFFNCGFSSCFDWNNNILSNSFFVEFFFQKQIQNNFPKLPQLLTIWKNDYDF
jgi:hypothetical protein